MATCCVADQFCTAPANFAGAVAHGICYICEQPVCSKCSSLRTYDNGIEKKKRRICNNCQVEMDGHEFTVMSRMYRLAGYHSVKLRELREHDGISDQYS